MAQNQNVPAIASVIAQAIDTMEQMVVANHFDIPENYSYKNAIQSVRFELTKPIEFGANKGKSLLEVCTPQSIMQSVIQMAQKGLNPDKNQCYFIPYGDRCTLSTSYQGRVMMAKRDGENIKDVYGYAVYEGEEFTVGFDVISGTYTLESYKPDPTTWDAKNLKGAFAVVLDNNSEVRYFEYMTMGQIRKAWGQGGAKGDSPAHKNFPDQMAIKTVKARAVKSFINSTDDTELFQGEAVERTDKILEGAKVTANKTAFAAPTQKAQMIETAHEVVDTETGEILEVDEVEETQQPERVNVLEGIDQLEEIDPANVPW